MEKSHRKSKKPSEVKSKDLNNSTGNRREDQSAARLFESSSNLESVEERVPLETEDSRQQKKNLAIIRNILEMFNMEDTKQKYEAQNVVEYVLDPNDFGYDCSLSTTRVRQRLCDLMGTDVIRLNDKKYFQKLTHRLQEEYETIMDKQEEARAASEDERLRRLMLDGIISAPNDYRAVIHGHEKKQNKKKKRRKIKRHNSGHVTYDTKTSDDEGQSKTRKEDVITQLEMLSDSRPSPSKSPGSADDRTTPETRKTSGKKVHIEDKNDRHSQTLNEDESMVTAKDFDTKSLPDRHGRKQSKYSTHEPDRVSKLRTEETVAGLYSIAEELVSPTGVDDQPSRKGKVTKAKKKITVSSLKQ